MKLINETHYDNESIGGENDSRWAELPRDILELIVERLIFQDSIRLGAVCMSWRLIVKAGSHLPLPMPQLPWLMLNNATDLPQSIQFYSLSETRVYALELPFFGICSAAAYDGWLVIHRIKEISSPTKESFLLNPLTRVLVSLPEISMLPRRCGKDFIYKITLSSSPTDLDGRVNKDCLAVGISHGGEIIFCKLGDVKWTTVKFDRGILFDTLVFNNGVLYVLDRNKELWMFEFGQQIVAKKLGIPHPVVREPGNNLDFKSFYLVVSGYKLLLVLRVSSFQPPEFKSGNDAEGKPLLFKGKQNRLNYLG